MMRLYTPLPVGLLIAIVLTSFVGAQIDQSALDNFQLKHPHAKFHGNQYFDSEGFCEFVGTADTIYGTVLAAGESPEASAWNFYSQIEGIYAQEIGTLVPGEQADGEVLQGVMWDRDTKTHRFYTFRFNQTIGNVPVFRSGIGFLVRNENQFPVVMSSNNLKEMQGFDAAAAAFVPAKATQVMIENAGKLMDEAPFFLGGPNFKSVLDNNDPEKPLPIEVANQRLVIWAGVSNVRVEQPELAIVFMAERGEIRDPATYGKHLIVAAVDDGAILYSENQVVADVNGTVSGQVSDGTSALECEPEVPFGLPYAEVEILGGNTVFADANGNFNIPDGTSGTVTVRSPLRGQYFEVFDDTMGGNTPFIDINVAAPGSVDILHNPNPTGEFATSNVNCYFRANEVRDFVLSFEPTFPTIANQTSFNITSNNDNISGITSCNATYNGSAINFMRNIGACNNTSIPDVVYHEYGHHLVNVTGNGQGQFGEGSGDTIGVLIEDHPELGQGFFEGDCANGIRSAENFRSYPCSGGIHDCGQLISGCVWDTLNEIRVSDPTNARDITAGLFIGMLIVRGQTFPGNSTIGPEITIIFLELDDDDGDIGNGTPHYSEIATAFGAHNMDAPPLNLLQFNYPSGRPEFVDPAGGIAFTVEVNSLLEDPQPDTGVLHVDTGSGFQSVPMNESAPNVYEVAFPPTACLTNINYYFSAQATNGQTQFDPINAPDGFYSAISAIDAVVVYQDDSESPNGWSVSGSVSDGAWDRGVPVGGGDRGDPPTDADGSGSAWLTDNVDGNSDVDGGTTILTSTTLDATSPAGMESVISYQRWYSNDTGDNPESDIFVVEVSDNNGATWTNLETVGPTGEQVRGGWINASYTISDFVVPNNQFRIRFSASDLGGGSIVEAGIDDLRITHVDCEGGGGGPMIGESGLVSALTHEWRTVNLNQSYTNPVVVMGTATRMGGDPITLRVRNVTSTTFEVAVYEYNYLDGIHNSAEDVPYVVLEAGLHTLADGTLIEAGTTMQVNGWNSIGLTAGFIATPIVFSQLMSDNGPHAVVTRHQNISTSSFEFQIFEEEAKDQVHTPELIGWIAVEPGSGVNGSYTYEASTTGDVVTHLNFNLNYMQVYGSAPLLFTSVQSFDGPDTCSVRGRTFDNLGATIYIEEERSANNEIRHTTETVGYWVMTPGAIE